MIEPDHSKYDKKLFDKCHANIFMIKRFTHARVVIEP